MRVSCPKRDDISILPTRAFFSHSHYPVIRGLLKGWMPATRRILRRRATAGDVLFTAIEPNLLTTWANARYAKRHGMKHMFFTWQNVPYAERLAGWKYRFAMAVVRSVIRNSAGAVAGNKKAAAILKSIAGPSFPVLQVPISGVDVDRFNATPDLAFRKQYGIEDKIIFLFAGVLDERKGLTTLIQAFSEIRKRRSDVSLVIVGSGHLKSALVELARSEDVASDVIFIPWMDNAALPGIFAAADVFVYPSEPYRGWQEQFGYSIAEASAVGVPVISTMSGSISDVVADGVTGILVPPGDSQALAGAMARCAENPDLRRTMGDAGRKFIREKFSHQKIAQQFEAFFESLP